MGHGGGPYGPRPRACLPCLRRRPADAPPYCAAERGLVDDVIDPAEAREVLIQSLAVLQTKHADLPSRKHGNPPQ
ncbi:carboxyl transferase domain-containing protein [Streptomyces sp. NPDC088719]|uniref:carboxyl transferase domain-containing protein n=1 Tax=Streptomyces sp. NPDC088719 TaxID=3365872 RepID=UPI00382C6747